jgi:zona occludens toxin (predicted ATPase)
MPVSSLLQLAKHRAERSGLDMFVVPEATMARVRRHAPRDPWRGYIVTPEGECLPWRI